MLGSSLTNPLRVAAKTRSVRPVDCVYLLLWSTAPSKAVATATRYEPKRSWKLVTVAIAVVLTFDSLFNMYSAVALSVNHILIT